MCQFIATTKLSPYLPTTKERKSDHPVETVKRRRYNDRDSAVLVSTRIELKEEAPSTPSTNKKRKQSECIIDPVSPLECSHDFRSKKRVKTSGIELKEEAPSTPSTNKKRKQSECIIYPVSSLECSHDSRSKRVKLSGKAAKPISIKVSPMNGFLLVS